MIHELSADDNISHHDALNYIEGQTTFLSYFGGGGFNQNSYDVSYSEWDGIPAFLYILPEYEIVSDNGVTQFKLYFKKEAVNKGAALSNLQSKLGAIVFRDDFLISESSKCEKESYLPLKKDWDSNIHVLKKRLII